MEVEFLDNALEDINYWKKSGNKVVQSKITSLLRRNIRIPIEIKSGQTVTGDYFKGIQFWNKMTQTEGGFVVYGGDMLQKRSNGIMVVPYQEMNTIAIDI